MPYDGEQVVFPIQIPQKRIRGRGWGNFKSEHGLTEVLCAFFERFKKVGLPVPVITLSHNGDSISTTQDESSYQEMVGWVSERPFLGVFNSLLTQLHNHTFELEGYYFSEVSEPLTEDDLEGYGIKTSPSWPEDIEGLRTAFRNLNYTRHNYSRQKQVEFATLGIPENFVYSSDPVPVTRHEAILDSSESTLGESDLIQYPSGQRVEFRFRDEKKLCWTGFMKPCSQSDYQSVVSSMSISDSGESSTNYDDLALTSASFSFTLTGLWEFYKQFLVSGTSLSPIRAHVKEMYLNDVLIPMRPKIPLDVSSYVKCGENTLRITYYGNASWSDIKLVQLMPVEFPLATQDGVAKMNRKCWTPIGVKPWLISDFTEDDAISFELHSTVSNDSDFECFSPTSSESSNTPDITITPPNPLYNQQFEIAFSIPEGAESYSLRLECKPKALGYTVTKQVASGTVQGRVMTVSTSLPIDSTVIWKAVVEFNTGASAKASIANYGSIWGDNSYPSVSGSVGAGSNCCDGPSGYYYGYYYYYSYYYPYSYGYSDPCILPSGIGDCSPVYTENDLTLFESCSSCSSDTGGYTISIPDVGFEESCPEGTSKNLVLFLYGSVASGEYTAEVDEIGQRTGSWSDASGRYGLIAGPTTEIVDYEADEGDEVISSLTLSHSDNFAVNLGAYEYGYDILTLTDRLI